MSEYQYYEFQAIDRTLTQEERAAISQLSSRVKPTATSAIFTYSYGDFSGSPEKILAQYFDVMYYIANWGTQQLMFRFPKSLIDREAIEPYCVKYCISLSFSEDWAILDWKYGNEEGFGWIEGEDTLSELLELRQEILQRDYRGLYLAWLKAITVSEEYADIDPTQLEPPIPPGLGQLSAAQKAFTEIFELDENLLAVASVSSGQLKTISDAMLREAIAQLSLTEGEAFLLRLAKGEPNLSAKFQQKLSQLIPTSPTFSQPRRTVEELLEATYEEEKKAEQRQQQEAERKRIQELEALAKRESQVWEQVESLVQKAQSKSYDEAVKLLVKLAELAEYQNRFAAFQGRLNQIYEQYSNRSGLKRRLQEVGLNQSN
ncbi:MAG: hypothetical protein IM466_03885 [Microcystis sp. M04BS1]|jgi:hypothetical protein|uniref:Uncharacterized protein n=1 Tax=Microcystis aeruginosa Ma_MB_S_20031200_S102 TaxID=2486254 RepID=A0A552ETV3_MICAE|nr:hypothetical protein [Microcystis aeruginosa]MCA2552896.1 hypothetical protein [Microcystis sp. M04BS1]NCS23171.1 hypothetical protein [Microcystis aeruginosa BS13-02]TRU20115.1 MAG: hypothetical protein EWV79_18870 [Microcystis aeruginosa Ma_MB_S_20031200_S102D]TRU37891.1 MAG: hypothetical protein EWV92_09585 [Microcystis aeruginosa Ma_MB_S_20031200_S102]MDB9507275.1 hypothetical protein [Microcystis aeruginosa CS-338/01]